MIAALKSLRITERKTGLPNEVAYRFEEDNEGRLWISTNKGIVRFNPETRQYKYFDGSDGFQSLEFATRSRQDIAKERVNCFLAA